jgi:hypothetical protein
MWQGASLVPVRMRQGCEAGFGAEIAVPFTPLSSKMQRTFRVTPIKPRTRNYARTHAQPPPLPPTPLLLPPPLAPLRSPSTSKHSLTLARTAQARTSSLMDREQTTEKLRNWTLDPFEYELYDLQQLVRPSARPRCWTAVLHHRADRRRQCERRWSECRYVTAWEMGSPPLHSCT